MTVEMTLESVVSSIGSSITSPSEITECDCVTISLSVAVGAHTVNEVAVSDESALSSLVVVCCGV